MENIFDKINTLSSEYKALLPMQEENKRKFDKKIRLEFNFNSNHLEGNTLTYGETELLLIFEDTRGNHNIREFEEMRAHDVAFKMIADFAQENGHQLTEQNIKNLNEIILVRPFWKDAITNDGQNTRRLIEVGNYKKYPNSVRLQNGEIFEYASPIDTPIKMRELIEWYRDEEKGLHPITLATMLHYKFVCIHPFDDGNGRVARLLMNYVFLKNNLPPVIIKSADKDNYLKALHDADTGNLESLISYVAEQLFWSLTLAIRAAKGENIEETNDLDKKIKILEQELSNINEDDEVKTHFNKEVLINIMESWGKKVFLEIIPTIQKFNHFFTEPRHHIRCASVWDSFINEPSFDIFTSLILKLDESLKKDNFQTHDCTIDITAQYGSLKKGGLNTFGCNYGVKIKFELTKYEVFVDEFQENKRIETKLYEKLLHKPLLDSEIELITSKLGEAIFNHIDYNTKEKGLR